MKSGRAYHQTLRAQKAADTEARILEVAEQVFSRELFDRVSLANLAAAAGVSIPTLQRRFGNKEGLFAAAGEQVRARVRAQRQPPPGDVDGALEVLLDHYEREGHMVWHLLKQEVDVPLLHTALEEGRKLHREWVETVFAPALIDLEGAPRRRKVDALVAATDVYLWKLLRIDLGRSRDQVALTLKSMAHAVVNGAH